MANLTQMRMMEALNGLLLVDKPEGIPFTSVVKAVKRNFNLVKVGHGGSLDAMASGLMVLLLGDANKFAERVMSFDRTYSGTLKLGATTDTGDRYGRPLTDFTPTLPLAEAKGDLFLAEPRFASIRKEGSAAYEIVETGEHAPQLSHIYRLQMDDAGVFTLIANKTLIPRALAHDLGATLTALRREKMGPLDVATATPFAKILELGPGDFASLVRPASILLG